jgi:hypothetical protein
VVIDGPDFWIVGNSYLAITSGLPVILNRDFLEAEFWAAWFFGGSTSGLRDTPNVELPLPLRV